MVSNWNKCVAKKGDIVYCVGDIIFARATKSYEILNRLNAPIALIKGNHDRGIESAKNRFIWIKDYYKLKVKDKDATGGVRQVVLFHYALRVWDASHYSSWSLWAHSHGTLEELPNSLSLDVGVDATAARLAKENNTSILPEYYRPVSYDEVKKWMATKIFKSIDHHDNLE